nr:hypothetical protein [Candidatus Sigynarchaeota archaeon]
MGRKKKDQDEDASNGQSVLGALGLSLPDVEGNQPQAKPAPVAQPAAPPVVQDSLMLSFGETAPTQVPSPPRRPVPAPAPAPIQSSQQSQPKPAVAQPRRLAALPELPKFVKPEDIQEIQGFDAPPVQGKGKITEITWNIKTAEQASNVVSRQSRPLSPLMAEALSQAKALRETIKQQHEPSRAAAAPQPKPAARPQPAPAAQPAPQPAAQARPAVKPAARLAPAPPMQQAPQPQAQPRPAPRPQPQPEPEEAPAVYEPEREIISTPVKSKLSDDVMTAQQPIEKRKWEEAKSVMAPMATSKFTAVAQQNFQTTPSAAFDQPAPRPRAIPAPVHAEMPQYEEQAPDAGAAQVTGQDQVLPGGKRVCGKCGNSNFREDDDKSKPLSFTPPFLFAKKYTCKSCGKLFGAEAQQTQVAATQPAPRPTRPSQVAARQAPAPAPAARPAARRVQTTWEDTAPVETVRPSDVAARQGPGQEPPAASEYEASPEQAGTRLVCPNCGGTAFNVIQDKTRPVSFGMGGMGTVYAKIHQCKKCGAKVD